MLARTPRSYIQEASRLRSTAESGQAERPRSKTMEVISAAVAKLGRFPDPVPLDPRSPYVDHLGCVTDFAAHRIWLKSLRMSPPRPPCGNPIERGGRLQFSPTCRCGHLIAAHKTGGAK